MDEFQKNELPTPTLHTAVQFAGVRYLPGSERDFAFAFCAQGESAVADLERLTGAGAISGFELVIERLKAGKPPFADTPSKEEEEEEEIEEEEIELPAVSKLAEWLTQFKDREVVAKIAEQDERPTAAPIYAKYLKDLG